MPEETDPPQPTPADPTIFGGVSPDEMIARAMQTARLSTGTGHWEPPSIEEAAHLFPGYAVLKLIGRGGMGAVYQARQIELDRLVAIKLLPLEVSVDRDFADRFRREARAMAKLHHPNIVTVFDFGTTCEGHLFFVMEFVEGANLADIIHQVGLDDDQALSVAEQICTALAYAHGKGVVHRDIKPANVMIDTESHVKVADFGLARLTDPSAEQMGSTVTGTVMGTPDYMAPEQTQGMNVDHRADIYSLGVMLYEMLCRQVPKGIFQPPSARVGCDARIDDIVIRAMQQAPEHRYQSTQEMKADVTAARTPVPVAPAVPTQIVHPHPVAQPARLASSNVVPVQALPARSPKKSRLPLYASVVIGIAAVGTGVTFFGKTKATKDQPFASGWISLMDKIDPAKDAVDGTWTRVTNGLMSDIAFGSRLQIPYAPPEEYDFRITFTRLDFKMQGRFSGWGDTSQSLAKDGGQFRWYMGAHGNTYFGFGRVGGRRFDQNPTAVKRDECLQLNHQYTSVVSVRKDSVKGYLDGQLISEWRPEFGALSEDTFCPMPDKKSIGIASVNVKTVFHDISVREVTGTGKFLRDAALSPAASATTATATKDKPFVNTLGMKFVPVPVTGGPTGGQRVLFSVWETRVQDYEVFAQETRREWPKPEFSQGPTHPAVMVSWVDAVAFFEWLSKKEGRKYRLPTDTEWSAAVGLGGESGSTPAEQEKSGKVAIYPWGKIWPPPRGAGNYGQSLQVDFFVNTAPAGSFAANVFGLHDLGGNVWEWCGDWYDTSQIGRVVRGGSWISGDDLLLRSSYRLSGLPVNRRDYYGFRCVLVDSGS